MKNVLLEKCQCGARLLLLSVSADTLGASAANYLHAGQPCGYKPSRFIEGASVDLENLANSEAATACAPFGWQVWQHEHAVAT
jgi:hypothetical protein